MTFKEQAARLRKPRPKLLDKREAKADVRKVDRDENAKVKARSQGQCEVREVIAYGNDGKPIRFLICHRRAGHIHHLISGIGRRNIGLSIKASAKLHVCELHHSEIHGHVLKPVDAICRYDAATVRYERIS